MEGLRVPGVTVVSATTVAATATAPAYCDVVGELNTSGAEAPPGSAGFELRFPENWNKKFLFFGVGGLGGATYADFFDNPVDLQESLSQGYTTAITDTGHLAGNTDASWALLPSGKPDEAKLVDYNFRAIHQVTLAGKQLTARFFGQPVELAYFDGCSNGGREALVEASNFPADYDGIIAGAPSRTRFALKAAGFAKQQLSPASYLPSALLPLIDAAVNKSCGMEDGVNDGLIQNPAACNFNPYTLLCAAGQKEGCLGVGQAQTLNTYLTALRTYDGGLVYPGYPVGGMATSATGPLSVGGTDFWNTGTVPPSNFSASEPWGNNGFSPAPIDYQFADHVIKFIITQSPDFNLRDYQVTAHGFIGFNALAEFTKRTAAGDAFAAAGLKSFLQQRRKLILYHGFSDPALSPFLTTQLYKELMAQAGSYDRIQQSARLFMVPGMQHCLGGPGPNVFDTLTALDAWVAKGVAPGSILATHYLNDDPFQPATRTMPLCAFPSEATYAGSGDVNNAASWSCKPNQRLLRVGSSGVQAGADGR